MPIPLIVIFSCGVGVSPAQKFDEKECQQEVYSNRKLLSPIRR